MGPLIRMIYLMSILLLKNLLLYALYITCCAAIFTAIFHAHALQFTDFSTTIISLFGSFVNNFNAFGFDDFGSSIHFSGKLSSIDDINLLPVRLTFKPHTESRLSHILNLSVKKMFSAFLQFSDTEKKVWFKKKL